MKIRLLELKNFGKFNEKKIELGPGINLIYGENEAGKSTLHSFLKAILFGMERKKGRAAQNDTFRQYEPWENPNYYAGGMEFTCGGKRFRLDRNFDKYQKSATLVCLDDGEQFSIEDGDLDMLLDGLKEDAYENTLCIGQLQAKVGQSLGMALDNFAANYYATGDAGLDLAQALEVLKKKRQAVEKQQKKLAEEENQMRMQLEQKKNLYEQEKEKLEANCQWIQEELLRLEGEIQKEQEVEEEVPSKWRIHPLELLLFAAFIIVSFAAIPKPWNGVIAIIVALACGIYVWNRMKAGKKKVKTDSERTLEEFIEESRARSYKLKGRRDQMIEQIKEKELQILNLEEQLRDQMERSETYKELELRKQALELATSRIQMLSGDEKGQLEQALNAAASEILQSITEGACTQMRLEDKLTLTIKKENRWVPVEKLSRGTIEQAYFALRMAVAKLTMEEAYPILLDDTFVYYDEKRLLNALKWLQKEERQVLLFTCHKREEGLLESLQIPYTKIELE